MLRLCCRRAILLCSNDGAASIRKSGPEIKNRCSLWAVLEGFLASIRKFGPEIKNRCTQEGLNGEILASIRKFGPEIKNRCTQKVVFGEILASISKSELEIKNRCTQKVVFGEILTSIPKFGPEIKNRCTQEGVNGEKLASIRKSGLEIKNRCTLALRRRSVGGTILLRCSEEWNRTRTSLPLRPLQAEPFSFAAAMNGIGCGPRRRYGRCRRNHSSLRQRKLESDADIVAATAAAGGAILLCDKKIESDTDLIAAL